MTEITLKNPIEVAGEQITSLQFKDPTVADIRKCGMPFTVDTNNGSRVVFDAEVIARYVSRLCAVPPSTVDKLSIPDFLQCQAVVMGFFGD